MNTKIIVSVFIIALVLSAGIASALSNSGDGNQNDVPALSTGELLLEIKDYVVENGERHDTIYGDVRSWYELDFVSKNKYYYVNVRDYENDGVIDDIELDVARGNSDLTDKWNDGDVFERYCQLRPGRDPSILELKIFWDNNIDGTPEVYQFFSVLDYNNPEASDYDKGLINEKIVDERPNTIKDPKINRDFSGLVSEVYEKLIITPTPTPTPAPFPSADTDTLLDGEWAEIQVSLPRGLSENDCFQIEIKTSTGGTSAIEVTVPGVIDPDPATGLLPPWSSSAASDGFSTDTGVGRSADGEHMTHYMFHLQPWYPTKSINLNEMALTYTDEEVSVELTPMGDKPLEGKGQWNYRKVDGYTPYPTPAPMPAPTAAPTIAPTPAPISPYSTSIPPSSIIGAAAVIVIILIAVVGISRKRKKGKSTKPQPPAEPPKPKTEPVKQKPIIKKEAPPPISGSLTIERAIYDPCKRDFVEGRLPRMKDWIERHDPGAYWFAMSIQNNADKTMEEWNVELGFSSALKIEEAKIEGIEIEIPHEAHLGLFKISVPKEYGIVIPKGGAQRVYFKLCAEKPKTTYEIAGVFKSAISGDVPIRTKEFKYLCDTNVSPEAVKAELKKTFSEKDAVRLANTFRVVQEIRSSYCNTDTKAGDVSKEFDLLKMYFTEKEFLDEIGGIQRKINAELREDERLDEKHVKEVKDFCGKFTEMWIARFLR